LIFPQAPYIIRKPKGLKGLKMKKEFPILEFDGSRDVKIDPRKEIAPVPGMPERCVLCFFDEAINNMVEKYPNEIISRFGSEACDQFKPIYKVDFDGTPVALAAAFLGGPFAVGEIDEISAMGAKKFLCIGSAGVLDKEIAKGGLILPTSALRDEGASYHYIAPSRWIDVESRVAAAIEKYLARNKIPFVKGKTWTTDAFYRETKGKFESRKAEGCISVEMECASYLAAAKYNGVDFGQILYGGDCLDGQEWDKRKWIEHTREERRYWLLEHAMKIIQEM
jgi:uridine phosphorylase